MHRLALLAGLLLSALPVSATNWNDIETVEHRVEQIGARVVWLRLNRDTCARRGILGSYRFSERTVYMCQQRIREYDNNDLLSTLKHEGWHAVQHLCNGNRAVLSDDKIRALLSQEDKDDLRGLYDSSQHRMEAEARALEHIPTYAYITGVNHYCS